MLIDKAGVDAVEDFHEMVQKIRSLKRRTVDEIVDDVKQWDRKSKTFQAELAALLSQLEDLRE